MTIIIPALGASVPSTKFHGQYGQRPTSARIWLANPLEIGLSRLRDLTLRAPRDVDQISLTSRPEIERAIGLLADIPSEAAGLLSDTDIARCAEIIGALGAEGNSHGR